MFIQAEPLSKEWFEARKGKITASSAASILCEPGTPGVYGTPLTEFTRITRELNGLAEADLPPDDDDEERAANEDDLEEEERTSERDDLEWGNNSEPIHRAMLAKAAKATIEPCTGLYVHDSFDWLAATPDGIVTCPVNGTGLAELKAPTRFGMLKWENDQPPFGYVIQVCVAMMCAKMPWDLLSVLVPPRPRWRRTYLTPEMEEFILSGLAEFWTEHVMRDLPPPATGSSKDLAALKALYPQSSTRRIVFSTPAIAAAQQLEDAKAAIKEAERQKADAQAVILSELGDAEAGVLPDGTGYTYKTQRSERKASEARTLEFRVLRKAKRL